MSKVFLKSLFKFKCSNIFFSSLLYIFTSFGSFYIFLLYPVVLIFVFFSTVSPMFSFGISIFPRLSFSDLVIVLIVRAPTMYDYLYYSDLFNRSLTKQFGYNDLMF